MQNFQFFKRERESSEKCPFCDKLLWTIPDADSTLKEKLEKHYFRTFIAK